MRFRGNDSVQANSQSLSPSLIEAFVQDGVVRIPQAFSPDWIELLRDGFSNAVANPSPRHSIRQIGANAPAYREDYWVWSQVPEFERFLRHSPVGEYAACALEAERINLVMANWFYREANCQARAPWHHDISYFDFSGRMCVFWIPLEASKRGEGIEFVRGSHRCNKLFMRVYFDGHEIAGDPGWVNGECYENPPAIDDDPDQYDLVSFDLELGDCLCFDIRTLHGSLPGRAPMSSQRRFTVRLAAEDGRICYRGDWAAAERAEFEKYGHQHGDAIDSDFFPRLWPKCESDKY